MGAEVGDPHALVDDRRLDDVGRHLDARHEVPGLDDLAVEHREDLERVEAVEPLELGDAHVDDAGLRGHQVDPALDRTARVESGSADRLGQAHGRLVLVQLAGVGEDDGDRRAGRRRGERVEVVAAEPPALRPALLADRQVAREDGTVQARRARVDQG